MMSFKMQSGTPLVKELRKIQNKQDRKKERKKEKSGTLALLTHEEWSQEGAEQCKGHQSQFEEGQNQSAEGKS